MKRSLKSVARWFTAAAFAVLLFYAVTASAQKNGRITVPFPFVANHQDIPAGQYKFDVDNPHILMLVNANTGYVQAALLVRSHLADDALIESGMTFKWNGVAWVLNDVHLANMGLQSDLAVRPRPVREFAMKTPVPMPTIFIAMN